MYASKYFFQIVLLKYESYKSRQYWIKSNNKNLTVGDINTLKLLYKIKPQITNEIDAKADYIPYFVLGAKEEIITKAIEKLQAEISGLNIVYYHNGYFNNDNEIYEEINAKSPKLILVAMGSPRQEQFIYNAKKVLKPSLMIGIGGSLDVWSGSIKRAPLLFQKLGIEWLYRTITQPSRIKRIFPTLPLFIIKAFNHRFLKQENYHAFSTRN